MPADKAAGRAVVVFDDGAFAEDLDHARSRARADGDAARREFERLGIEVGRLRPCDREGRDGTQLAGCVKTYIPWPAGRFGMVFAVERVEGRLVLVFVAFGVRHQPRQANAPTVYARAHRRLHGAWPRAQSR